MTNVGEKTAPNDSYKVYSNRGPRFGLLDKLIAHKNLTKADLKASMTRKEFTQNKLVELEHAQVDLEKRI